MAAIVQVKNLTKAFGDQIVLDNITVDFAEGRITGLVGRNGSGKTMLFRCILGLMPFSMGEILVRGKRVGVDVTVPDDVGMIIEGPGFLPNYSGFDNLRLLSLIQRRISKSEIIQAISAVHLDPKSRKHVSKYSMGMRQRLCIAQAIMENPSILILDEPMNGLDNEGVRDMRDLLKRLQDEGKTILLASHNSLDIENLCDYVYGMEAGVLNQLSHATGA